MSRSEGLDVPRDPHKQVRGPCQRLAKLCDTPTTAAAGLHGCIMTYYCVCGETVHHATATAARSRVFCGGHAAAPGCVVMSGALS